MFAGAVCCLVILLPASSWAIDRINVSYGLREYVEYNDNLFTITESDGNAKKIDAFTVNTAPDLSILYDDGETRWLARGSYRRESFPDEEDAGGDFWAASGEFSRALNPRVTFSLLAGYTRASSLQLGGTLDEPGQRSVIRPSRGLTSVGTFWSPALTVFWSKRFRTTLNYEERLSFAAESANSIDRSLSLSGSYALSPRTMLKGVIAAQTNRNSGLPFVDRADSNGLFVRFGFLHVLSPKLTLDLSAGPQWTKEINLPDKVTLRRNALIAVTDPLFGTSEQTFLSEPGQKVDDLTLGLSLNFQVSYVWDDKTRLNLLVSQGTTTGEGSAGTQETREANVSITRKVNSRWTAGLLASATQLDSFVNEFAILLDKDPKTGETLALDRDSFDLRRSFSLRELTVEPRLDYRINSWTTAYALWNWTEQKQDVGGTRVRVNRVQMGIVFRRNAYY